MSKFLMVAACVCVLLVGAPAGLTLDDEAPTVAILQFGQFISFSNTTDAIFGVLHGTGTISMQELSALRAGHDIESEHIRVLQADAGFDFANLTLIVEQALDDGADILVTLSTPVTQAAINVTEDMDSPPALLFSSVGHPYAAGIADAACLKPAHVTGLRNITPYHDIMSVLLTQSAELSTIGALYSTSEVSGVLGAQAIVEVGERLGLQVIEAGAVSLADLELATEGLVSKGAEAIVVSADYVTVNGLPLIMQIAAQHSIPVLHSTANSVNHGATVSAGGAEDIQYGGLIGIMLMMAMQGELDLAATPISGFSVGLTVGVNLDMAELQGIEIAEELLMRADTIIEDGKIVNTRLIDDLATLGFEEDTLDLVRAELANFEVGSTRLELPDEVMAAMLASAGSAGNMALGKGYIQSMACTEAMIAEQRAALADSE